MLSMSWSHLGNVGYTHDERRGEESQMLETWRPVSRSALVFVMAGVLLACSADQSGPRDDLAEACSSAGGTWLFEHLECEIDDQTWCEARGGEFDDCASPCRHSPGEICVTVCQPLCSFAQ